MPRKTTHGFYLSGSVGKMRNSSPTKPSEMTVIVGAFFRDFGKLDREVKRKLLRRSVRLRERRIPKPKFRRHLAVVKSCKTHVEARRSCVYFATKNGRVCNHQNPRISEAARVCRRRPGRNHSAALHYLSAIPGAVDFEPDAPGLSQTTDEAIPDVGGRELQQNL